MKKYQYDNAQEIVKQMREDRKMAAKYILNYDIYQIFVPYLPYKLLYF